jgi:hypothetical protein
VKTTVEINDQLFARAQRKAKREGKTMRSLIEEGLRLCLDADAEAVAERYVLPDRSVGDPDAPDPLESMTWPEVRDEIYGGR